MSPPFFIRSIPTWVRWELSSLHRWLFSARKAIYQEASLFRIGAFSTLYFCAAFSFFVNFWFYLPIIFQVVFFKLFSNLTERVAEAGAAEHHRGLPSGTESAIH